MFETPFESKKEEQDNDIVRGEDLTLPTPWDLFVNSYEKVSNQEGVEKETLERLESDATQLSGLIGHIKSSLGKDSVSVLSGRTLVFEYTLSKHSLYLVPILRGHTLLHGYGLAASKVSEEGEEVTLKFTVGLTNPFMQEGKS